MELTYRWAERDDAGEIRHFLVKNFGERSIQAAPGRFDALFLHHPRDFHIALCVNGNEIVGLRCYLPAHMYCGYELRRAAYPIDMMVKSDYRRQGIGSRFLTMAWERFMFIVSTGQSEAQANLYRKKGAAIIARYQEGLLVRKPTMQGTAKAMARDMLSWLRWIGRPKVQGRFQKIAAEQAVARAKLFPRRFDQGEAGNAIEPRDFLWRYAGTFYNRYNFALLTSGEHEGILVYKQTDSESRIIDLICPTTSVATLLRIAGAELPGPRVTALFAGNLLETWFVEAGFLVRPRGARLVLYSSEPALQEEMAQRSWVVFAGDSDTELIAFP